MRGLGTWIARRARATWDWLRSRTPLEAAGLVLGLAVFIYLGSDGAIWDARVTLALHLVALGVVAGLVLAAMRGTPMPRTPLELPLLALLAALALATASALNHGMSLRAFASIAAYAAMLPVALIALRHRPSWVALVVSLPPLVVAVPGLLVLVERRVEWVLAGAPGLPPIRLPHEGSPWGSVAVPPFVLWPAWAVAGLIEPAWLRRAVRLGLVVVAIPYTILSGSRSAWLALLVAAVIGGIPWAWGRRRAALDLLHRRPTLAWAAAAGGAAVLGAAAVLIAPRAAALTSVIYRVNLWRDTLAAWATDPLTGIGPGFMPIARQAAAADGTFPVRQPHSHNIPLGILGDGGLLALAAAMVVVAVLAVVAGPWRSRSGTGRAAAIVLLGLAIAGLSEDITFMPNFSLMVIVLVAVALTDAGAVTWRPIAVPRRLVPAVLVAGAASATILVSGMVTADAGAVAYRRGIDAYGNGHWRAAAAAFERSAALDPWHPSAPKAASLAASRLGREEVARREAETAAARNPGDGEAWTNLALLCTELGDEPCQRRAAERAIATASFSSREYINAALVLEGLGLTHPADAAYRQSVLTSRGTTLAVEWPRRIAIGDARPPEGYGAAGELNRLLGIIAAEEPVRPEEIESPAVRALAHAIRGEADDARASLASATETAPDEVLTWEIAVVVRRHLGDPYEDAQRIGEVVYGGGFPPEHKAVETARITSDIAVFRLVPEDGLVLRAERLKTVPPWPWILEELLP